MTKVPEHRPCAGRHFRVPAAGGVGVEARGWAGGWKGCVISPSRPRLRELRHPQLLRLGRHPVPDPPHHPPCALGRLSPRRPRHAAPDTLFGERPSVPLRPVTLQIQVIQMRDAPLIVPASLPGTRSGSLLGRQGPARSLGGAMLISRLNSSSERNQSLARQGSCQCGRG